jgi:hypothetical protein
LRVKNLCISYMSVDSVTFLASYVNHLWNTAWHCRIWGGSHFSQVCQIHIRNVNLYMISVWQTCWWSVSSYPNVTKLCQSTRRPVGKSLILRDKTSRVPCTKIYWLLYKQIYVLYLSINFVSEGKLEEILSLYSGDKGFRIFCASRRSVLIVFCVHQLSRSKVSPLTGFVLYVAFNDKRWSVYCWYWVEDFTIEE